jgi:hypothetical protein
MPRILDRPRKLKIKNTELKIGHSLPGVDLRFVIYMGDFS